MPPKKERLSKYDFSNLQKKKTIKSYFFDVVYTASETPKVGCVVLKKRTKKATDRNTIKRKIYHGYREVKPKTPYTVIFYPRHEVLRVPQKNLVDEIRKVFATLQ